MFIFYQKETNQSSKVPNTFFNLLRHNESPEEAVFFTKVVQVRVPDFLSDRDVKVAAAIEALVKGSISVGKAAEIAEISPQEFLVELKKRGIKAYPYTDKEALKELEL